MQSNILKELYSGINKTELSGDFILPDSLPDAKSVLHATSSCRRKNQYLKDGKLTYDIESVCTVLYADENNELRSVKYRSESSDTVSVKGCDSGCTATVFAMPADTSVRMSNPRKFSIRCQCPMQIKVYSPTSAEYTADITDGDDIQVQSEQVPSMQVVCGGEEGIAVSEDITIPGEKAEPKELLGVYLVPRILELKSSDGKVVMRGEVAVSVFYKTADNEYESYDKTVNFSQIVPVEGAGEDSSCLGEMFLYDVTSELSPDSNGQMRIVELDFLYDIRICCTSNTEAEIVSDVYSLSRSGETEYKTVDIRSVSGIFNSNVSVNEKIPLDDKGISRIIYSTFSTENCKCEPSASSAVCTGDIIADCVILRDGQISSESFSFPFKATVDVGSINGESEYSVFADCDRGKLRFDSESIYCDTEVYLTVSALATQSKKVVSSLKLGEEEASEAILPLTLYYTTKGDTVWNVAKKYRSTVSDIISANSLTSTDISECRVLVIPKIRTY